MTAEHLQKVRADFEGSPFWNFIGLRLKELKEGYVLLALPIQKDFINVRNSVHGGIYASVMDTAMGMAGRSLGYDEVATLHLNIQYLKSVMDGTVYSEAEIIHQNRSTVLIEGRLKNEDGELIGHCTGTFKLSKGEKV
ncbi:PaaI family thioesterase [Bacillus sp. CMF12]|uniref:PaaI family thioesterase n=1 Tax=Bacillaceae TaxID=186817 RepID=UPI001FB2B2EA|nr:MULTISPECIES: PaaI family thioesterase [Bacillaceae]MCS0788577.1 PaaI family thioesterase [Cytobacillus firmus]UOE55202.1 PaaI family thioesterase [Cytobacillus oceanisediminis]USK49654.1 PaaI family thioesterase [Bacillus sp. CMF12]